MLPSVHVVCRSKIRVPSPSVPNRSPLPTSSASIEICVRSGTLPANGFSMPNSAFVKCEIGTLSLRLRKNPPRNSLTMPEPKTCTSVSDKRPLIGLLVALVQRQRVAVGQRIDAGLIRVEELPGKHGSRARSGGRRWR